MRRLCSLRVPVLMLLLTSVLQLGCGASTGTPQELGLEDDALLSAQWEDEEDDTEDICKDEEPGGGGGTEKVTLCHRPPGNPENEQTLTLGKPGACAHLREHEDDTLGPCEKKCRKKDKEDGEHHAEWDDEEERCEEDEKEGRKKVLLCHVPPGNPDNAHVIRVAEPGAIAHLRQHEGDHILKCDKEPKAQWDGGDDPKKCPKPKDRCEPKKHDTHDTPPSRGRQPEKR